MILKVFRTQQPVNFFILPVVALVLWLPAFFRAAPPPPAGETMPLFAFVTSWLHGATAVLLAWLLVVLEALYLHFIISKYEVLFRTSFLPALVYIFLMSFSPDVQWLHPVLFVNLLVLACFDKAFALFKHPAPVRLTFESSLFTGLAFLFYFPAAIYYLLLLLSLGIIRSLTVRGWIITVVGFLLPLYFTGIGFVWNDSLPQLLHTLAAFRPSLPPSGSFHFPLPAVLAGSVTGILLLLALLRLRRNFYKNTIRTRSNQRIFLYALFAAVIPLVFPPAGAAYALTLFVIPLSVLLGYYLSSFKRREWMADGWAALLAATVIWNLVARPV